MRSFDRAASTVPFLNLPLEPYHLRNQSLPYRKREKPSLPHQRNHPFYIGETIPSIPGKLYLPYRETIPSIQEKLPLPHRRNSPSIQKIFFLTVWLETWSCPESFLHYAFPELLHVYNTITEERCLLLLRSTILMSVCGTRLLNYVSQLFSESPKPHARLRSSALCWLHGLDSSKTGPLFWRSLDRTK